DRLGESCSLLSTTKDQSVSWRVDWNDFDKTDKKINEVHAYLSIVSTKIHSRVQDVLTREQIDVIEKSMRDIKKSKDFRSFFKTGTHIEINFVRDYWDRSAIEDIKSNLEILVPPSEDNSFVLFFLCDKYPILN